MRIMIEKRRRSGELFLLCGEEFDKCTDSLYEEFEIRNIYGLGNLVEWAIRRSYADGVHDGRE
jgi:hypothetical protein